MTPNIAKNTLYLTTAYVGQKVLAFVYFIVLARVMMPENTGVYFLALSITTIFAVVADFGVSPVVIREVAKRPDEAKTLIRQAIGLKIPLILMAVITSVLAALVLQYDPIIIKLVALATVVMAADSISLLFFGVLRGMHSLKYESLGIFIGQIITVTIGGFSLWLYPNLFILIGGLALGSTFNAFFSTCFVVKKLGKEILKPVFDKPKAIKFFKIALPFALAGIFVKLYSYVDSVLISKIISTEAVGIYAIAYKYTYAFQFLPLAFIAALYPGFSSLIVNDKKRLQQVFEEALWYMMILATPIVFGIWSIAPEIVSLAGVEYSDSAMILQVLIFVLIPIFLDFPVGSLLNAADKQVTKTTLMGITMIINVVLNAILIPIHGPLGAAYAAIVSFSFLFLSGLYFVPKILEDFKLWQLSKMVLPIALSGIVMAIVVVYAKKTLGFYPVIPLGAISYILMLLLTKSLRKQHFVKFRQVLKK